MFFGGKWEVSDTIANVCICLLLIDSLWKKCCWLSKVNAICLEKIYIIETPSKELSYLNKRK